MFVRRLTQCWDRLLRDRRGAAALEYALLVSLIAVVVIGAVIALDDSLTQRWAFISSWLETSS